MDEIVEYEAHLYRDKPATTCLNFVTQTTNSIVRPL